MFLIVWLVVTVYAIADWARTPEEEMPGRTPRILWLIIILLTIPSFSLGAIVWLICRAVGRAEQGGARTGSTPGGPLFGRARSQRPTQPPAPIAPDDDPDFLFKLERDIRRRRAAEDRDEKQKPDGTDGGPAIGSSDASSTPAHGPVDGSAGENNGPQGGTGSADSASDPDGDDPTKPQAPKA